MTITLALIGCGGIARRHVLAMKDLQERGRGDFAVTAVCDANQSAAQEKADMFEELLGLRPTIYTDHQAVINSGTVDAVDSVCRMVCITALPLIVWKRVCTSSVKSRWASPSKPAS